MGSGAGAPEDDRTLIAWLFEDSRDPMFVVDSDGVCRSANRAWRAVLGWRPDEVEGRPITGLAHPDDLAAFDQVMAGLADAASVRLRDRTSAWRSFEIRRRPSGDGRLMAWLRTTDDRAADAGDAAALTAARQAEHEMEQLVLGAPFAAAMFDRDLRYKVASPRWLAMSGLEPGARIGKRLQDVFPNLPKRFVTAHRRVLQGEVVSTPEDRITDSRGNAHWVRWEARPWRDLDGEIAGTMAYLQDISALTETRRDAQANAKRLKLALEAADAGVYEIDHVAKTFWASPELQTIIGGRSASYDDVRSLKFPHFHPDDIEHVRAAFLAAAARGAQPKAFECRIVRPNGDVRWVRVFHQLKVSRSGRWLKGVGLVHDNDVRKRQELDLVEAQRAAEAASEAKAAFLANMSHEIRTPMNGVMGVLHLLKTEALSAEGRGMLEEALTCGEMLAELLNDVIDFSKIEAGRLELSNQPLDPGELAQGVARLLHPQAHAKGLALKVEADPGVGWVSADPLRLRQALFNLVGNAVKFTLEGAVTLRCRRGDAPGRLRFEVQDTGVGVPLDVQPRIFQRFDQGDASTTRRFGGSGLGLAITRKLAEMMGGDVGFTSTEGVGSVFWIEVAAEPAIAPDAVAEVGGDVLGGLRILVVEDNATNRVIATKLLENLGAEVETAADGLLGVEAARHATYDLILMDVQMPGIDGLEASRRIRRLPGESAHTPIVALTANVLAHQRDAYLQAGMDGVVGKPISPAALVTEIARLCVGDPCGDEAAA